MTADDERFRAVLENRSEVLRSLCDSPATKPELVSALRLSRSSVDRAIRDLTEVACVTSEGNEYRATTTGRVALTEYDQYRESAHSIQDADRFLNHLPVDEAPDAALLEGAEITLADSHAPEQALESSIDLFRDATALRGLAPVVLTFYPRLITDELQHSDLTVEIVAEETVLDTLPNLVGAPTDRLHERDSIDLYTTGMSLPYALWFMETPDERYAGITAYDAGGVIGVLINDTDAAVDWAHTEYRKYREQAEAVEAQAI